MTKKRKNINKKGFSILEVLIALFVLVVGVLGMLTMISNSVRSSSESRDIVMASQISQEGIELVRWVRDNSVESGAGSFAKFGSSVLSRGCRIDFSRARAMLSGASMDCSATIGTDMTPSTAYQLYYNDRISGGSTSGVFWSYNHDTDASGTSSGFYRKIVILSPASPPTDEIFVKSIVYWGKNWSTPPDLSGSNCFEANKCVYTEGKLTSWAD